MTNGTRRGWGVSVTPWPLLLPGKTRYPLYRRLAVVLEKDEKIRWTDHVRNEDVLVRVKEQRNILHEIHKWKANWIGHNLHRNCLAATGYWRKDKGGGGGKEVTGRWGRSCRKLLDNLKERRGYPYLKEEVLGHTGWRVRFGRGFGPVVRKTIWMN
jgi:hypothetical protein